LTSLAGAEAAAAKLSKATIISIPGIGHVVAPQSPCAQTIITSFLAGPHDLASRRMHGGKGDIAIDHAECRLNHLAAVVYLGNDAVGFVLAIERNRELRPFWIVLNPIRRVCDHKVRLDAAEHALDIRRDRAVAAEETVPPQQPQIARLRHRMLRSLRRVVGIRQPLRAVREQIAEFKIAEPRQR
jgi:hypothetical protein